jgi:uncharacterized protein (UPF0248 family)
MLTAQALLNQIRWDERLDADVFVIGYYDRVDDKIIKVMFNEIRFPEDHHFQFEIADETGTWRSIPYHRVREIYRNGKLIWHRD